MVLYRYCAPDASAPVVVINQSPNCGNSEGSSQKFAKIRYMDYCVRKDWEKESIHRPAPVRNFLCRQNGGDRGNISVVDMVSWFYRVFASTTSLESSL